MVCVAAVSPMVAASLAISCFSVLAFTLVLPGPVLHTAALPGAGTATATAAALPSLTRCGSAVPILIATTGGGPTAGACPSCTTPTCATCHSCLPATATLGPLTGDWKVRWSRAARGGGGGPDNPGAPRAASAHTTMLLVGVAVIKRGAPAVAGATAASVARPAPGGCGTLTRSSMLLLLLLLLLRTLLQRKLLSQAIKVRMCKALTPCQPTARVHHQQTTHEVQSSLGKLAHVALLQSLRPRHVWKLETNEAGVAQKQFHLGTRQWPEHLLDDVQLIDL